MCLSSSCSGKVAPFSGKGAECDLKDDENNGLWMTQEWLSVRWRSRCATRRTHTPRHATTKPCGPKGSE
ncbi:hypothetical protein LSAT2_008570 [Lamellibrachia satsuma]|nr:hypothetical protein LSAT2_008570 [Lamellibrachia satsuma]